MPERTPYQEQLKAALEYKLAGRTKEEYIEAESASVRFAAQRLRMRPAELSMCLTDIDLSAREVWGGLIIDG